MKITRKQRRARKDSKYYTYDGETHTLKEWSEILGVAKRTLWRRMAEGRPIEDVFSTDRRVGNTYGAYMKSYMNRLEREAEERMYGENSNDVR